MSTLQFVALRDSQSRAVVATGRYLIVDYGREGWDATFTSAVGVETALPTEQGARFHKASRHAMACCEKHHAAQVAANA
jgi:hypothetical protein